MFQREEIGAAAPSSQRFTKLRPTRTKTELGLQWGGPLAHIGALKQCCKYFFLAPKEQYSCKEEARL